MKSYLVIGLGQFGRHLTAKLVELGNEVMAVDAQEERVSRMADIATAVCVGDCQDELQLLFRDIEIVKMGTEKRCQK